MLKRNDIPSAKVVEMSKTMTRTEIAIELRCSESLVFLATNGLRHDSPMIKKKVIASEGKTCFCGSPTMDGNWRLCSDCYYGHKNVIEPDCIYAT